MLSDLYFSYKDNCVIVLVRCNFIEITLRYWCSPVNLLHIFRTSFSKNTSEWLLLNIIRKSHTHCLVQLESIHFRESFLKIIEKVLLDYFK